MLLVHELVNFNYQLDTKSLNDQLYKTGMPVGYVVENCLVN